MLTNFINSYFFINLMFSARNLSELKNEMKLLLYYLNKTLYQKNTFTYYLIKTMLLVQTNH